MKFEYNKNKDNRVHATDVFIKRLKLRGLNEDKSFLIKSSVNMGTKVSFNLKL